jgi:Uma2 family endonuclease
MTVTMEPASATDELWNPRAKTLLESLELPPGFKAELIEGDIVVTPPPGGDHEGYFSDVAYELGRQGWRHSGNIGLITPLGKFIPDLTVARREYIIAPAPPSGWRDPTGVALVVEITSSNPSNDRDSKRRGYAQAGIPVYLLIDRHAKETVVFSEPQHGDYSAAEHCTLAGPIPLPEPLNFTLEGLLA